MNARLVNSFKMQPPPLPIDNALMLASAVIYYSLENGLKFNYIRSAAI